MTEPPYTLPSGAVIQPLTGTAPVVLPPLTKEQMERNPDLSALPPVNLPLPKAATPAASPKKTTRSPRKRPAPDDDEEEELEVLATRVSLVDIVSRQRISKCVKSHRCTHRQAFDFESFCKVNGIMMEFYDRIDLVDSRFGVVPLTIDTPQEGKESGSRESSLEIVKQRFKVELKPGKTLTQVGHLKLTKKRKGAHTYRCPVCNIKFMSVDLIHDDFMATVMGNVPQGVESVEIDDSNVVTVVETKKPYEVSQDIISLSDEDDDNADDVEIVQENNNGVKRKKVKIFSDDDDGFSSLSEFFDTDESGDEYFAVEGTADDPVVID